MATVSILFVTALLFIVFAVKNRQIDRLTQQIYERMAAAEKSQAALMTAYREEQDATLSFMNAFTNDTDSVDHSGGAFN